MYPSNIYGIESSNPKIETKQNFGYWVGRIWSLSIGQLVMIIRQIMQATLGYFIDFKETKPKKTQPTAPSSLLTRLKKEETVMKSQTESTPNKRIPEKTNVPLLTDDILSPLPTPLPTPQDVHVSVYEEIPIAPELQDLVEYPHLPTPQYPEEQPAIPFNLEDEGIENKEPELTRADRRRMKRRERTVPLYTFLHTAEPLSLPTKVVTTPSTTTSKTVTPITKPPTTKIIECGGKGDCQLLSLAEGLKRQHPDIGRKGADGKLTLFTGEDLRKMAVDFARQQINAPSIHTAAVLDYIEFDRKDYNQAYIGEVEKEWNKEKEQLEKNFKNNKIRGDQYEKQKRATTDKYKQKIDFLEATLICDGEEFLKRLETKGFACCALPLYALSNILEIPIHVHDKEGIKGNDIQFFNPTESKKEPIHLHLEKGHYKLMIFPKT